MKKYRRWVYMNKESQEKIRKVCIDCKYFISGSGDIDLPHICGGGNIHEEIKGAINEPRECETYIRKKSPVSDYMDDFNIYKWKIGKSPFNDFRRQYCDDCGEAECYKEKIDIIRCIKVREFFDGEKGVAIHDIMDLITDFTTGMVKTEEKEE
jgi:hypothetical protein